MATGPYSELTLKTGQDLKLEREGPKGEKRGRREAYGKLNAKRIAQYADWKGDLEF